MNLAPRQLEIVERICLGMSDKQIARSLGISPNTVRTHLSFMFNKFGVDSRTQLGVMYFKHLEKTHATAGSTVPVGSRLIQ